MGLSLQDHTELLVCGFCPIQKGKSKNQWSSNGWWEEFERKRCDSLRYFWSKFIQSELLVLCAGVLCIQRLWLYIFSHFCSCTLALSLGLNCSETQERPRYVFSVNYVDSIKCSTFFFFLQLSLISSKFLQTRALNQMSSDKAPVPQQTFEQVLKRAVLTVAACMNLLEQLGLFKY